MKVISRWRAGPSLLSFAKIRKYNIPRVSLIYPPIQSGKYSLFSSLSVEFLFYKRSLSMCIGIFNVLKLLFQFWPQLSLPLIPLKALKPVLFLLLSLVREVSFLLWTEILTLVTIPLEFPAVLWPSQCNVRAFVSTCGTEQTGACQARSRRRSLHSDTPHHHT